MVHESSVHVHTARLLFCGTAKGSKEPVAGIPLTERRLLFCSSDESDSLKPSSSASWIPVNKIICLVKIFNNNYTVSRQSVVYV